MKTLTRLPISPSPPPTDLARFPWRNPSQWAFWRDRRIDGEAVSFSHLWPFDMKLSRAARGELPPLSIDIRVVFDCHVCTEAYVPGAHQIADGSERLWLDAGRSVRVFQPQRYTLSKQLPSMIRGLADGKTRCYGAGRHNYMVWKPHGTSRDAAHYQAYFDLYRTDEANPRLVMYVQSAYLKDRPMGVQRKRALVFATVCANTLGSPRPHR